MTPDEFKALVPTLFEENREPAMAALRAACKAICWRCATDQKRKRGWHMRTDEEDDYSDFCPSGALWELIEALEKEN